MRRDVQAVLLVLFGGAVLRITLAGTYVNYVKPAMKPFLLVSAVVLLALGVAAFVDVLRGRGEAGDDSHGSGEPHAEHGAGHTTGAADTTDAGHPTGAADTTDAGHTTDAADTTDTYDDGHNHGRMRTAWLLLLPVAAIFLIAPGPLGAYTATRATASVRAPADTRPAELPAGDPVPVALDDFAIRAVWDDGRTLTGRTVELIGFVTPTAQGWDLARMSMSCCAADAVTMKVRPVGALPDLPADTWVAVTGTYNPGGGTGSPEVVPWLDVQRVVPVPRPANPYL